MNKMSWCFLIIQIILNIIVLPSINADSISSGTAHHREVSGYAKSLRRSRTSKDLKLTPDTVNDNSEDTSSYLRNFKPYLDDSDTDKLTEQQKQLLRNIAGNLAAFEPEIIQEHQRKSMNFDENPNEGRARTKKNSKRKAKRPATTIVVVPPKESSSTSTTTTTRTTPKPVTTKANKATTKVSAINGITVTNANRSSTSSTETTTSIERDVGREDSASKLRPDPEPVESKIRPIETSSPSSAATPTNTSASGKPTKYHYYPHNQHIYLLPECAIQQVCNAVYVRLNYTQPLCACPSRYRDPCSASLNEDDLHTTKLIGDSTKRAVTLAKTCEATTEMRECRAPRDWSLLALQNIRTGKSHYLVICRCPDNFHLEGPMAHDQPTYASVPGIRVFGMMCVKPGALSQQAQQQQQQQLASHQATHPNKRYQEQSSTSGIYVKPNGQSSHKINNVSLPPFRPTTDNGYQKFPSSTYNYLKRPGSVIINNKPENSGDNFATFGYGRNQNNEAEEKSTVMERTKRSADEDAEHIFPAEKLQEFYDSINWNAEE